MNLRFRKSIKIAPGVKVNLSKKGVSSIGIGKSGASINLNKKGIRTNVGIPGTGLSYSKFNSYKKVNEQNHISTPIEKSREPSSLPHSKNLMLILVGICCFLIGVIFF